jgi:DNA-binding transcriptional MerR regulator
VQGDDLAMGRRGHHKIATVSRLTGFSPELLRAWEQRHQLLNPSRGPGGQRLYSDEDVALLQGVRAMLDRGRSIGEIASVSRRQLLHAGAWPAKPTAVERRPFDIGATRVMQIATRAVGRLCARLAPAEVLEHIVDTIAADFQAALARVWIYQPSQNVLLLRASAGLSRQTSTSSRARIDLSQYRYKVGVVARSGEAFVSNAIVGDDDFDQRWVRRERLQSVAVLPLMADEALQGILAAFFRAPLGEEVIGALRMFSAVAAASIAAHRRGNGGERLYA